MRRITDLRTRGAKKHLVEEKACEVSCKLFFINDLIYCLSQYDRRLKSLCKCKHLNSNRTSNILLPWKKSYERRVYYEGKTAFSISIGPFINLESLDVVDSRDFDLSVIEHTGIKRLALYKVLNTVVLRSLMGTSLQEIVLRKQPIAYENLEKILEIPSLISVTLDTVEITDCADWKAQLLKRLERMPRLKKMEMVNMEVDLQRFIELCISKDLTQFMFSGNGMHAEARLDATSANILRFQNSLEYFTFFDFRIVETVYIKGADIRHMMELGLPDLRSMYAEQVIVDSNTFRNVYSKLPRLVKLGFVECIFDHISFYEILSHFKDSLRYLDLRSSNLPHDYISFLQIKLIFCFVILKNGEECIVDNTDRTKRNTNLSS